MSKVDSRALASLMGLPVDGAAMAWRPEELGAVLRHQLEAPLLFDLKSVDAGGRFTLDRQTCWVDGVELHTFGDLFSHPHPPVELLCLTKEFAKTSDARDASPLPPEVATVLYFGAIAVAWVRCGEMISQLTSREVVKGMRWSGRLEWLTAELSDVLGQAVASLSEDRRANESNQDFAS